MLIPLTMAALLLLTAALLVVRLFWMRLPPVLRRFLIRGSVAVILVQVFFSVTKWGTTSTYVNVWINWMAIAGYELLVLLFSRLSPRWLTSISALILIVPLFASTILLPLTGIFRRGTITKRPIGADMYYKVIPWSNNGMGNSGVDVEMYYRARFAPFLSHKIDTQPFNDMECNASAAVAEPGSRPRTVVVRCPHWPTQPGGADDKILELDVQ